MWERQQNTNTKGSESHQHFPWTHNTRKTPFTFPFILVYCLVVHKSWLYTCRRRQTSTYRLESKITPKNMATWSFWLVFILWKATPEHLSTWCIPEPMNQSLGRAVPSQHQHGAHHVEWSSCSLPSYQPPQKTHQGPNTYDGHGGRHIRLSRCLMEAPQSRTTQMTPIQTMARETRLIPTNTLLKPAAAATE